MVSLTCGTDHRDGVTLVTARLQGAGVAQRVRLTNRLDGPVWPPRRHGVPEAGWDEDGFETVVPAGEVVAVGYASPAPPVDAPVAIVEREIVDEGAAEETSVTAAAALRDLGDPSPPRDAVPVAVDDAPEAPGQARHASTDQASEDPAEGKVRRSGEASVPESAPPSRADQPSADQGARRAIGQSNEAVPEAVAAWLDDVDERVTVAERLAGAESVPEATAAIRAAGGLDEAEALVERLHREAAALETVEDRADELAERTAAEDVPFETLERLA